MTPTTESSNESDFQTSVRKMAQKSGTAKTASRSKNRSRNVPYQNLERHLHVVQCLRPFLVLLPWNG